MSPVEFIGERKGSLTTIVAARFYFTGTEDQTEAYMRRIDEIAQDLDDPWNVALGSFDRSPDSPHRTFFEGIISYSNHRVGLYLANIDSL